MSKDECVKVVVRCRPLDKKEIESGFADVVKVHSDKNMIEVEGGKQFYFDQVYGSNSSQKDIFEKTFQNLIHSVLEGFNGTIFAYGQTGTGKTFTMQGLRNNQEMQGVIPNSFQYIFNYISCTTDLEFLVRASYLEIYMEEIRDLLSKDQKARLELREHPESGVYVKDLSSFVTKNEQEILQIMDVGNQNRSVGSTNMNEQSSRSHAIFIITIECSEDKKNEEGKNYRVGKLNMVDLAGSERQSKTNAEGDRLKEATKINLSLSSLGNVISALVDSKNTHIPYRDSKLTRLLQDSLGGNAKTVMVANIGPANYNLDETLTTLRYASRAKNIKNKPHVNEDPKDALLRKFQEEIKRLKEALSKTGSSNLKQGLKTANANDVSSEDDDIQEQRMKFESEKLLIANDQNLLSEEKERLLSDLNEKERCLQQEKEVKSDLISKIQKMESKLLTGNRNIVDHTNEQQMALNLKKKQIEEHQRKEKEMKQKIEEHEETALNLFETYTSSQQEAEIKTKKLKKIFKQLQTIKNEIVDDKNDHLRERENCQQTINDLICEVKLKSLIIENFIPHNDKKLFLLKTFYDENAENWLVKSDGENKNCLDLNLECKNDLNGYMQDNFIQVELDLPTRTTQDYEGPTIAPKIQAVLHAALIEDNFGDVINDSSSNALSDYPNIKRKKNRYPTSKGLVKK
ncbi:hypothetical protein HELRODRAFT_68699 [Helobdella robusta]|uniref:Kinesin-like protein n=1 Tax=Helobdella robusta TaxID=6412 RepID=T1FZI5_HELRO|nr:hypothetical protein HELRODRAFT_68699 [Helobdella robusta]ESN94380.1 hypothetical protein HELRODRAFT_68699 [Helobdella robusta]